MVPWHQEHADDRLYATTLHAQAAVRMLGMYGGDVAFIGVTMKSEREGCQKDDDLWGIERISSTRITASQ